MNTTLSNAWKYIDDVRWDTVWSKMQRQGWKCTDDGYFRPHCANAQLWTLTPGEDYFTTSKAAAHWFQHTRVNYIKNLAGAMCLLYTAVRVGDDCATVDRYSALVHICGRTVGSALDVATAHRHVSLESKKKIGIEDRDAVSMAVLVNRNIELELAF